MSALKTITVVWFAVAGMQMLNAECSSSDVPTPIFKKCQEAVQRGDAVTLKRLLEGSPEVALEKGGNGETLLHFVAIFAFKGNPAESDLVHSLIDAGAAVNAYNKFGFTPLHEAAMARSIPVSSALLRAGADVRALKKFPGLENLPAELQHPEDGETPIDIASCRGFPFLVEKLLAADVRIEYPETQRLKGLPPVKDSALHFACRNGVYSKSTDKEKKDACRTIDLLCAKISDVNLKNFEGRSPLLVCADWGSPVIIEHLLTKYPKVKINFQDPFGNSAMHLAADGKTTPELGAEVIRILLKHGSDRNIENVHGETPLSIAHTKGKKEIISLLNED